MRSILILICGAMFGSAVFATDLRITSVSGVSGSLTTGNTVTIIGGTAGPICSPVTGYGTCNSCKVATACTNSLGVDQAPLCSCNSNRITDSTIVRINLLKPIKSNHTAYLVNPNGVPLENVSPSNLGDFVDFRWRDICASSPNITSCDRLNTSVLAHIFIDQNDNGILDSGDLSIPVIFKIVSPGPDYNIFGSPISEGIGSFTPFPGNRMVTIERLTVNTEFPLTSYGSRVKVARVFVSDSSMLKANTNEAILRVDLPVSADGTGLTKSKIVGLVNGKIYFFRIGLLDDAGNLIQYIPDMTNLTASHPECVGMGAGITCPFAAVPGTVY